MRRIELAIVLSGVLAFTACGSSTPNATGKGGSGGKSGSGGNAAGTSGGGTGGNAAGTSGGGSGGGGMAGSAAGMDGGAPDAPQSDATDGPVLTTQEMRGQYLVNSVLGCPGCHTPKAVDGGIPGALSGVDCFATTGGGCLSSANLTADDTGIANLSDQQVKDAFTKGIFPMEAADGGVQYLFANMPYYQFSFLTTADADAIVSYLRSLPPVHHMVTANSGTSFATRFSAPQWTAPALTDLPNPSAADGGTDAGDAGAASPANGKYFAALLCSTCHTVNTAATAPLEIDATKAFQGGKTATVTVTVPIDGGTDGGDAGPDAATTMSAQKQIESANLTPDTTGLSGWTAAQISAAITTAKDKQARAICGMRALGSLKPSDATDIATYLQAIPAVANTIAPTCY